MAVHTEHFKCENHLPGVERTMTACFDVMRPHECDGSVNLLGQRMGDFEETELCGVLREAGVRIGLRLPAAAVWRTFATPPPPGSTSSWTIPALPLARKMRQAFGTPYVLFDKYVSPARIAPAIKRSLTCWGCHCLLALKICAPGRKLPANRRGANCAA